MLVPAPTADRMKLNEKIGLFTIAWKYKIG